MANRSGGIGLCLVGSTALLGLVLWLAVPGRAPAAATRPGHRARGPVTGSAARTQGVLAPAVAPTDIAPSPNFPQDCSGTTYDDSSTCVDSVLDAIGDARQQEGLPVMALPTDWYRLSPQEQLFTATNLERTVRGLPALSGMATALDSASAQAAAMSDDPSPPSGFPWTSWGGNWAAGVGNPLEAVYYWMYDDCTSSDSSDCWGHRDNILLALRCAPCVMGVGLDLTAWHGLPSWTELLVDTSGSPALDFAWSQVEPDLPGQAPGAMVGSEALGVAPRRGDGYWLVAVDGGVFAFGDAGYFGSLPGLHRLPGPPVVAMGATPAENGYWLVGSDGGVFAFGAAPFEGSLPGLGVSVSDVRGIVATTDDRGYFLVGADGGVFAFGDARYLGSLPGEGVHRDDIVGVAATASDRGYWVVATDGAVFAFGDAVGYGSAVGTPSPVAGMASSADGRGYWVVTRAGGVDAFGDADSFGSLPGLHLKPAHPIVGIVPTSDDKGYWLVGSDGGAFAFGDAPFLGSLPGLGVSVSDIVGSVPTSP